MSRPFKFLRALGLPVLLLALAACDSAEDRAARHLENAQALLAGGDLGAAALEFRNVLEFAPNDREALLHLAEIQMARGGEDAAFGLYQRLVDNHPDTTEAWLSLAEIAIRRTRWQDAATFAAEAEARAPDSERTALIRAALAFRAALEAKDAPAAAEAAVVARRHVVGEPGSLIARQILIANAGSFLGPDEALGEIDAALAVLPDIYVLHQMKVQTLGQLGRTEAVGPALEAMAQQFPETVEPQQLLVQWYLRRGEPEAVERFLRERASADAAVLADRLTLVRFLRETQGPAPALAEIDRQLAALPADAATDSAIMRGLRATLLFDQGEAAVAIPEIEAVLNAMPAGADANNLRVALARMLASTGREADAMQQIETVLAADSGHVEAGKIKAVQLIARDETDAAIRLLRQAQATDPRDADVVRLMGEAHARAGNWELAGERFAQAVELSNKAPRESLVYADFLLQQGRPGPAETVLVDALRQSATDVTLLRALGEVHLRANRLDEARRVIAQLRTLDSDQSRQAAGALEAAVLLREDRVDDTQALVERMTDEGRGDAASLAALIQARIRAGDVAAAQTLLDSFSARFPDDPLLAFLSAGMHMVKGEVEAAEAGYRAILAEAPGAAPPLRVLYGLLVQQGRDAEAQALLEETRAAAPEAVLPRLLLATRAEQRGDAEAAAALYEDIYADDSSNLVVANNLANLLMAREDDPAAIDRAHAITRRLRGTEEPAFQHTFGWIAYLRGDYNTALEYLARSAEALPEEPIVLLHLGMTYRALERPDEARAALEQVLALTAAGGGPQAERARAVLEGM